jgi:hypothetical protein
MSARRCLHALSCAAVAFASSTVLAAPGRIVLVTGQVIEGDIQEVAKGDYIIVKLPSGDVSAVRWQDVDSYTFDVATDKPKTAYVPAPPPPVYVYEAPPPRVRVVLPPPPPFEPRWMIGARTGTMVGAGNVYGDYYDSYYDHYHYDAASRPRLRVGDVAGWGWMFEGDLGYHFSPSWTLYGFWEHGELERGDLNASAGRSHTNAVGVGVQANSSPDGAFGFYFDLGASYRWMDFGDASTDPNFVPKTRTTVEGFDYLRAAVGVSIRMSRRFHLDPHIYSSSGYFTEFRGNSCHGGCSYEGKSFESGFHTFSGLAVAGRFEL